MMLTPFGSILMGALAGVVSTVGFEYVTPYMAERLKIADTCGVHNLHGMPAILGGFLSILIAGIATKDEYDQFNVAGEDPDKSSLYETFPLNFENGDMWSWTKNYQAGMQAAGMGITLLLAISSGALTGVILKIIKVFEQRVQDRWNKQQRDYLYHDDLYIYKDYDDDDNEVELLNGVKCDVEMASALRA